MQIPEPLNNTDLLSIYYFLKLNRGLEERLTTLYKQGTITATVFTSKGQEAISVDFSDDIIVTSKQIFFPHLKEESFTDTFRTVHDSTRLA